MYGLIPIDCGVGISLAGATESLGKEKEGNTMRRARGLGLALALVFGLSVGTLPLSGYEAAAQTLTIRGEECGINLLAVCSNTDSETGEGGDATSRGGNGGRGGDGGFASVHDIANAVASATSSVTVGDITTGNAFGHTINVDATNSDDPVVLAIAGSFSDTGVDIFAPGGNAQAGTTGGYGLNADASGGDGGDGGNSRATGGNSGDSDVDSCNALLLGCFNSLL
jgi:hypothetical protein